MLARLRATSPTRFEGRADDASPMFLDEEKAREHPYAGEQRELTRKIADPVTWRRAVDVREPALDGGAVALAASHSRTSARSDRSLPVARRAGSVEAPLLEGRQAEVELLARALRQEPEAVERLVRKLRPAIQAEIGRTLQRHHRCSSAAAPAEVLDLTQEVFLGLFENDARKLRAWSPARGRGLTSFVRLVARHHAVSFLRSPSRNIWSRWVSAPSDPPGGDPVRRAEARDGVGRLLEALEAELSPRSWALFESLFVEESSVDEICQAFGMSRLALYAWRSRFRRQVRATARRLGLGDLL